LLKIFSLRKPKGPDYEQNKELQEEEQTKLPEKMLTPCHFLFRANGSTVADGDFLSFYL
jgi:hypothetical protein